MNELVINQQDKTAAFSPREFVLKNLKYIPWLILSVTLFIVLAYVKLRYSTSIYDVQSKLLIKKDSRSGGGDKFEDLFMMNGSQNLNDEIQILKSTGLSKRIVRELGLQTSYYAHGNVKISILHAKESPIWCEILQVKDSSQSFGFNIKFVDETVFNINEETKPVYFGQVIENNYGRFRFTKGAGNIQQYVSNIFQIIWRPLDDVSAEIANGFNIAPINDYSNVLLIRYETENPRLGRDIVNQLMKEYNFSSVEDKRTTTVYTLEFIDERLDTIQQELGEVEQNLQNFQEKNRAIDLPQQSVISFGELNEVNRTLTTQEVQLRIVDFLSEYLDDKRNSDRTVTTSLGITEPSLQVLIGEYNAAQLRKETQLRTTTAANPLIKDLEVDIEKLRQQIRENLSNIRQAYVINRNNLLSKTRQTETEIGAVPGKGRRLLEITRQQKILQDLYSYLLQKRLETSISSASTISNSKVLEPATSSYEPIKPVHKSMYILALLLGLGIPVALIALKEYLNDKITSRADVERLTKAPILGEIGHSDGNETLVVTKNNRRFISEQFRIIRTNLQFIINKNEQPVILITSSFSGEGKSFVSTNVGAVLALTGKKTVILEFDIRKPKIVANLDLSRKSGITNYIVGQATLEEMIIPVTQVENLYVIPCGPIPPNPAELLLDEKVSELFKELKNRFDAIIIDSAPLGLVSDAVILSAYADATLYIMRQNYTLKKQIGMVDDIYRNNKLPAISLLLNDVKVNSTYGGYYGKYGYQYGYGGDYFEKEGTKKNGMLKRFKKYITRK